MPCQVLLFLLKVHSHSILFLPRQITCVLSQQSLNKDSGFTVLARRPRTSTNIGFLEGCTCTQCWSTIDEVAMPGMPRQETERAKRLREVIMLEETYYVRPESPTIWLFTRRTHGNVITKATMEVLPKSRVLEAQQRLVFVGMMVEHAILALDCFVSVGYEMISGEQRLSCST